MSVGEYRKMRGRTGCCHDISKAQLASVAPESYVSLGLCLSALEQSDKALDGRSKFFAALDLLV